MKRILVLLMLFISTPVFAMEATVTRAQKEISDKCYNLINTQHAVHEVLTCLGKASQNDYIWRNGWETHVKANVTQLLIDPSWLKYKDLSYVELEMIKVMLKQSLYTLFIQSGQAAYQAEKTNMTIQQVNKLK